jgi:hypothetical protein
MDLNDEADGRSSPSSPEPVAEPFAPPGVSTRWAAVALLILISVALTALVASRITARAGGVVPDTKGHSWGEY